MDLTHEYSNLMILQTQHDNTASWNNLDHGMAMQITHPSISHHHLSSYTTSSNQTPTSSSFPIIHDHRKQEQKEECSTDHNLEPADQEEEELGAMKEMMYKIAAMQPVDIDPATIQKPTRRNTRISHDPQSVAARRRRQRISDKIRILQRLVPGGTKMDTATMLEEAARYVKFLKRHIHNLQSDQTTGRSSSSISSLRGDLLVEHNYIGHDHLNDGNYNREVITPNDSFW